MARFFPQATALLLLCASSIFTQAVTDVDILNFALNLECLEATFYSYAVFGRGLSAELRGGGPVPYGGTRAKLSANVAQYAKAIARDEIAHVRYLREALGDAAVPCPLINVGSAFALAANYAAGVKVTPTPTGYGTDLLFLLASFIFEDVGVTAYKGASPLIQNPAYLEVAGGILATEAYHAGAIRQILYQRHEEYIYPFRTTVETFAQQLSDLRSAASGAMDDQGLVENGTVILVPADENAIVYSRTTDQVLSIVLLGASMKGGFFPEGLNGNIK